MSVVKFLELSAQSPQGYEDAVRQTVERATSTIRNVPRLFNALYLKGGESRKCHR